MAATRKISEEQRQKMIADAAYFRAQQRGFSDGDSVADWLAAEREVDAMLSGSDSHDWLAALDERLATANGKLRAFRKKVSAMKSDAREEWEQDVEKLAKLRDSFQTRLEEIRDQGEHASDKAKQRAEKIWSDISHVIERVSTRQKAPRNDSKPSRRG